MSKVIFSSKMFSLYSPDGLIFKKKCMINVRTAEISKKAKLEASFLEKENALKAHHHSLINAFHLHYK